MLIDSWTEHCPEVVQQAKPAEKNVIPIIIPKGTTGKVHPLDVYGFRIWKNYVRHFSDSVIQLDYDLNLHIRNNIIKLQSLVHIQLSSPRYHSLFNYSWFKSGYVAEKPGEFENPVDFSFKTFSNTLNEISGCQNVAAIRCSWCKKYLYFKHFFEEHHYSTTYNE